MEDGGSHPGADTASLEESMCQLSLGGDGGDNPPYPERPGEPGCNYYMRTGRCDFGHKCRFNHPRNRAVAATAIPGMDYPERAGQPVCQYFLKTGSCKFGTTCKYHHPRRDGAVNPLQLNIYGYPIRKGEKECSYYVKNGNCKFGATCKFHHPQPALMSANEPGHSFYPSMVSPYHLSTMVNGQGALTLPMGSGSYVHGPYGPIFVPSEMLPVPGWSPYMPSVGPVADEDNSVYGLSNQISSSASPYTQQYQNAPIFHLSNGQRDNLLPERPDQPECQHYVKTGQCKFGSTCKFHHPSEKITAKASYFLNPVGLPLRPGAPYCIFFAQHGVCKFGPSCKFDHPMRALTYNTSSSSLIDMPLAAPFPLTSPTITLSPSSFSTDLGQGVMPATALSLSTVQAPQIPTPSSNSCNGTFSDDTASGVETR